MEQWLPLFKILLNSPSPESEASFFLFEQQNLFNSPPTSSFLSLLLSPIPTLSSSSSSQKSLIYLQSFPFPIQTRILSLLAAETHRFNPLLLQSIASHILNFHPISSPDNPSFWVRRAACNLFDVLPDSVFESEQGGKGDEFDSLPHWLVDVAKTTSPYLPWLPVDVKFFQKSVCSKFVEKTMKVKIETLSEIDTGDVNLARLHPWAIEKASALKAEVLNTDSAAKFVDMADELKQLCSESGAENELNLLELIEPWEANDESLSVLLLHLVNDCSLFSKNWPSYVLCSMALPKLLTLQSPASRALISAIICFCNNHQIAAVEALILPLLLHKEGINVVHCDVLMRIIKECLHPFHVSAFCQRLLCEGGKGRRIVLLPFHQGLISEQMVWTESSFNLFQNLMNLDVFFTPDTNDQLFCVIVEMASKFSKSLKFGNFLLCFVTKCNHLVNAHKFQLREAAEKTSTLVTRTILSRLNA